MRSVGIIVLVSTALGLSLSSCKSSYERQADAEYSHSQKATGDERLSAIKRAYYFYNKAINAVQSTDAVSTSLRSRFVELSVVRARQILSEGDVNAEPLPIFESDIEKYFSSELPSAVKQDYAMLLAQIADSFAQRGLNIRAMRYFDKAISFASDRNAIAGMRQTIIGKAASENLDIAAKEFAAAKSGHDVESALRAEYYAGAALLFDSTLADAQKLLADCHKENLGQYSNYRKVIDNMPDTSLFRRVQKFDILLAVTGLSRGGSVSMTVHMFNNSYEPLMKLKAGDFFIVDKSGTRYPATGAKEIEPLDQYHQASFQFRFPKPKDDIEKLVYDCSPHYAEKLF